MAPRLVCSQSLSSRSSLRPGGSGPRTRGGCARPSCSSGRDPGVEAQAKRALRAGGALDEVLSVVAPVRAIAAPESPDATVAPRLARRELHGSSAALVAVAAHPAVRTAMAGAAADAFGPTQTAAASRRRAASRNSASPGRSSRLCWSSETSPLARQDRDRRALRDAGDHEVELRVGERDAALGPVEPSDSPRQRAPSPWKPSARRAACPAAASRRAGAPRRCGA